MIGKTLSASKLAKEHEVKILRLIRDDKPLTRLSARKLEQADILLIEGKIKDLMNLKGEEKLEIVPEHRLQDKDLKAEDLAMVQTLVPPNSHLIGRTLKNIYFHRRHGVIVLAVQRRGQRLREKIDDIQFAAGDALLLQGPIDEIEELRKDEHFIVLKEIEEGLLRKRKAPLALGIIAGVVLLATLHIMPIVASAIVGGVLMVLTGCLSLEDAYEAIDWKVIFLLADILPLGIVMETIGAVALITRASLWPSPLPLR